MSDRELDSISLPAGREELERRWPRLLAEILVHSGSPLAPDRAEEEMRADESFMKLVGGWDDMPTASQANAWEMIQDRLWDKARSSREYCIRCGECCRRGAPVLYDQDRPALAAGVFGPDRLVTLRAGEKAWSNREGRVVVLDRERIKLRPVPDSAACAYLSPGGDACLVYSDRPHACRVLECWDPSRYDRLLNLPPLTRLDLLGRDTDMGRLIARHEERCGVPDAARAAEELRSQAAGAEEKLLDAVAFDLHVREFASREFERPAAEMDFYFGAPLAGVLRGFGAAVQEDEEGRLTVRAVD